MTKIFIWDLDGTLSNCDHRRHFVRTQPPNWQAFNGSCFADEPHADIVWLNTLFSTQGICLVASGRSDDHKEATIKWLNANGVKFEQLYMRKAGDMRSDYVIKKEILEQIRKEYGEPYMAIDDRDQVCQMWRDNGIRCLQVAEGNF
jgi:hypothetical protein